MKICFIVDYLPKPYSESHFSGAEVSIDLLFKALGSYGYKVEYACYSDLFRVSTYKNLPDSFWLNPIIIIIGAIRLIKQMSVIKPDVIHIHGKNSIYSAFLANLFFRLPTVITVRDYKLLCNLGTCLLDGEEICDTYNYIKNDVPRYSVKYSKTPTFTKAKLILLSPLELFRRKIAKHLLLSFDKVICISRGQEKIYKNSGLKNTTVIYNLALIKETFTKKVIKEKLIVYTGRYSPGKGEIILNYVIDKLSHKHPNWKLGVIGNFGLSKIHKKNITYYGQVPLDQYQHLVSKASLAIVPSVWPEPFGRAALDAICVGTPAVVTNRGGLPEIVDAGHTGIVKQPSPESFYDGIEEALKKIGLLQENILASKQQLIEKFYKKPIEMHFKLYDQVKK